MSITTRRAVAAFASTAVAAAGLAALTPAATAASGPVDFSCDVPLLGKTAFAVDADTDLPATVVAGKKVTFRFTAKVSAPDSVRGSALAFFGEKVTGGAAVSTTVGGSAAAVAANLPVTTIPAAAGPLDLTVAGQGSWTPTGTGAQDVKVSGFTANLKFIKGGVESNDPLAIPCSVATPVVVDTVTVKAAAKPSASKTTAKVKYSKKSKKATVSTSVKVGKSAASGKVKIKLAKGKKTVKSVTVKLRKGKASASFKKIANKGKYTATVSYAGSSSVKKSSKKVTFTVK